MRFSGEVSAVQHLPVPSPSGPGLRVLRGAVPGPGGALHQPHQLPGAQGERARVPQHDALHRDGRVQGDRADGRGVRQGRSGETLITAVSARATFVTIYYLLTRIDVENNTAQHALLTILHP